MKVEIKTFPPQKRTVVYKDHSYYIQFPEHTFILVEKRPFIRKQKKLYLFLNVNGLWYSPFTIMPNIEHDSQVCLKEKSINHFWNSSFNSHNEILINRLLYKDWWHNAFVASLEPLFFEIQDYIKTHPEIMDLLFKKGFRSNYLAAYYFFNKGKIELCLKCLEHNSQFLSYKFHCYFDRPKHKKVYEFVMNKMKNQDRCQIESFCYNMMERENWGLINYILKNHYNFYDWQRLERFYYQNPMAQNKFDKLVKKYGN